MIPSWGVVPTCFVLRFLLALDRKAEENAGDVLFGTIGWTGNYRFTFEVDNENGLRVLSGINPYASEYSLKPNEVFRTPEFIFTYSTEGKGKPAAISSVGHANIS